MTDLTQRVAIECTRLETALLDSTVPGIDSVRLLITQVRHQRSRESLDLLKSKMYSRLNMQQIADTSSRLSALEVLISGSSPSAPPVVTRADAPWTVHPEIWKRNRIKFHSTGQSSLAQRINDVLSQPLLHGDLS